MSRPLRIEFPDALYHITARGDRREAIFEDDEDRRAFLRTLGQVVKRFNWLCYAWCLMDNHYHLLIQTPYGNLSMGYGNSMVILSTFHREIKLLFCAAERLGFVA